MRVCNVKDAIQESKEMLQSWAEYRVGEGKGIFLFPLGLSHCAYCAIYFDNMCRGCPWGEAHGRCSRSESFYGKFKDASIIKVVFKDTIMPFDYEAVQTFVETYPAKTLSDALRMKAQVLRMIVRWYKENAVRESQGALEKLESMIPTYERL